MSAARGRGDLAAGPALAACALALCVGAALRALGLRSDLWLDEIWTWSSVRALEHPTAVFTLHDSNNHYLNTLWFYVVGDAPGWLLRLPSWIAGTASVALGAALAWRRGRLEAVFGAALLAGCFALVHFSSEARGYAAMVAFALAAQLSLEADLARPRPRARLGFALCTALGLLSQLVFVFYWAGALAQSLWCLSALPPRRLALRLAALHAAPLALLGVLYQVDLRALVVGGGNPTDLRLLLAQSVGYALGLPISRTLWLPYAAAGLGLVGAGVALRARARDASWIQALVTILLAPIACLALLRPEVIAERYFLIGIAFALLLGADLAAAGWRAGGARRALAALALVAFALGNASYIQAFARHGRGGFRAALLEMAARTPGPRIEVGSDHDFRNGLVLSYYARELPPGKQLVYVPRARWPQGGPEWLVRHAAQRPPVAPTAVAAGGARYRLVAEYDHAAISGFYWALYHREVSDAAP